MDTELLKTFLEVSRTRHFGRAAEALYLTQSAVSFRIRQLENQLGVNLFTRHRNNIRLTPAGERLLPYAETLMSTWIAARKEVSQTARHNEFSIGASASLWECLLPGWLTQAYQKNPGMQFEARVSQRQFLVKQLHERQLDLLITTEAPKMDELSSELLGHFDLALYCQTEAIPAKNLTYIRLEWGPDFQHHEQGLASQDEVPSMTTGSAQLACKMVEAIDGCTWLPSVWARENTTFTTVPGYPEVVRPIYAIWLQNSDKHEQIRSLISIPMQ